MGLQSREKLKVLYTDEVIFQRANWTTELDPHTSGWVQLPDLMVKTQSKTVVDSGIAGRVAGPVLTRRTAAATTEFDPLELALEVTKREQWGIKTHLHCPMSRSGNSGSLSTYLDALRTS